MELQQQTFFLNGIFQKLTAEAFTQKEPKVFKTLNLLRMIKKLNFVADEEFVPTLLASIVVDFDLEK